MIQILAKGISSVTSLMAPLVALQKYSLITVEYDAVFRVRIHEEPYHVWAEETSPAGDDNGSFIVVHLNEIFKVEL